MKTVSHWIESARIPKFPQPDKNLTVDVVIIGGGITGVTTAYLFKKRGYRVSLLERERCGGVDTSYTTAHLTCVTDVRLKNLAKSFGKDRAKLVWDAGRAAIDQIFNNICAQEIDCNFAWASGYLHAPCGADRSDRKSFSNEAALARELGFDAEFLEKVPLFEVPGIKFPHQARFNPLKYLAGLLKAIPGDGSFVFEQAEVTRFADEPLSVTAANHNIRCEYLVIATHTPLMGNTGMVSATLFQTKLYLYTSYVIGAKVAKGSIPDALFWDTNEPYYYLRLDPQKDFDLAIFGGQDHKTGQRKRESAAFRELERELHRRLPHAKPQLRWSGQVIETNDGLPFIGETADRQFVATGFAGNGMTFGTLSAMMAVDAMERKKNPWSDLFSPNRKKLRGGTLEYLTENKDYPYYYLRDRLARAEGKNAKAVKRNEGKILNLDGKKVAAYRDEHGKLTLRSPVCTHMGCIVTWNDAEKTWDCPCHGSRFKPTGEVMSGPAESDLEKIKAE
jgi:glycine/D-amino acid oxidase-like deaminating enzyme/nitrite reductase/ring-hydroxylating ferredoxin subunit